MYRRVEFVAFSVALLVLFTGRSANAKYKNYAPVLENPDYGSTWSLLAPDRMLTNNGDSFPIYADSSEDWEKSTCRRDLLTLAEAVARREVWALTMLDASSKLQSGLLQGNLVDLGQYDECSAVHSSNNGIRGRHCMYSISATQGNSTIPINPTLSICLPATCSADNIIAFFNTTISWINEITDLKREIASATCSAVDTVVWDPEFNVCLAILVGFLTFLTACTAIELTQKNLVAGERRHPLIGALAAFSLKKSAASILDMDVKNGTLPALHGIRVLSMAWIVLGHEYVLSIGAANVNALDILKWVQSWNSLYIFIAPFAVDTFFAMSGFLMTYLFFKEMPKKKRFNVPMYYLHRYVRLTPPVIALVVFAIVFVPKLGSGAQWDATLNFILGSCRTKWWPQLVYLQNFVEKDKMCLAHLWYLAVDMQLFWVSPLILYPLYRAPKFGLILLSALFFASLVIPATVIGIKKLPIVSFTHSLNTTIVMEIFHDIYEIPYHRATAWLVGIFWGYEVAIHDRQLNRWNVVAGWLTAIVSFAFCAFGTRSFMDPHYEYNAAWETFFSVVSRPLWAFGVCWIIYASTKNCAGPLSSLLSFRIFLPLSRLSYCIYLVHFVLQTVHVASLRTSLYFSAYYIWRSFFSTLVISIVIAFLFSLLFESPIIVLEKMLKQRYRKSRFESQRELIPNDEEDLKAEK
ncbi:nose resistant to fluoxetine protein 6-like [Phymastichus coffea]|uniref:nose resistant to fluoxetine protein 6-like n=1 Tax=Phymastichus coffea TaxID=108790 RepID=UPI00273BD0C7|nr:nose resistant to fluoxetine protein 6-like [Phymastichus coffea]